MILPFNALMIVPGCHIVLLSVNEEECDAHEFTPYHAATILTEISNRKPKGDYKDTCQD